ncbi:hypothetical protein SDC9_52885 [bioreactor metagenome]|uniref:Uncharacterized protein n=1 Tax=bioreactor metagenome TaxID=1076179 RepID=A0A644WX19_9ZZZZ
MQQQLVSSFKYGSVDDLIVEFRSQCDSCKTLGFTTGEYGTSVGSWQITHFAPDRTDFIHFASIKSHTFVEIHVANRFFHHIVIVTANKRFLNIQFLFGNGSQKFLFNGIKIILTLMFIGSAAFCHFIGFRVTKIHDSFAKIFIVHFVAVFAFGICLVDFCRQLELSFDLFFNGSMSKFQCFHHHFFADFLHFAFHHIDIFSVGSNHQFEVGIFKFFHGRIDDKFAVDTCNTNFRDGAVKRNVGDGKCR